MALYHLSVKAVSRSAGRSATAAAAYRAGCEITDERTGERHDYTRKGGVEHSEIILPDGAEWTPSRSELWNAAELAEKRKDGCVAREHEVALPAELSPDQRLDLARQYARDLASRHGCAVDLAIHEPHQDRNGESNENWHAHLLCTTRQVEGDGLGQKCRREQAGQDRKAALEGERSGWASMQNAALEKAGQEARVDHRSLAAQGIDREPTSHRGVAVTGMERRGVETDVGQRLAAAQAEGERQREQARAEARALDKQIFASARDLGLALAERDSKKLDERKEHERRDAAAVFGGIRANLSAADIAGGRAGEAIAELGRAREGDAETTGNQHARRAEEAARAVGAQLGQLSPEIAAAVGRLEAVVQEREHQARLAYLAALEAKHAPPIITQPEPAQPVQEKAAAPVPVVEDQTPAEYIAWRNSAEKDKHTAMVRDGDPINGRVVGLKTLGGQDYALVNIGREQQRLMPVSHHDASRLALGTKIEMRYKEGGSMYQQAAEAPRNTDLVFLGRSEMRERKLGHPTHAVFQQADGKKLEVPLTTPLDKALRGQTVREGDRIRLNDDMQIELQSRDRGRGR